MHQRIIHLVYPQSGYIRIKSFNKKDNERKTLLECFYPQAEVEDPHWSILKQKAEIPSKVIQTNIEELISSSAVTVRDLFSPSRVVTRSYRYAPTTYCIHASFTNIITYAYETHIRFSFILRASLQNAFHAS